MRQTTVSIQEWNWGSPPCTGVGTNWSLWGHRRKWCRAAASALHQGATIRAHCCEWTESRVVWEALLGQKEGRGRARASPKEAPPSPPCPSQAEFFTGWSRYLRKMRQHSQKWPRKHVPEPGFTPSFQLLQHKTIQLPPGPAWDPLHTAAPGHAGPGSWSASAVLLRLARTSSQALNLHKLSNCLFSEVFFQELYLLFCILRDLSQIYVQTAPPSNKP